MAQGQTRREREHTKRWSDRYLSDAVSNDKNAIGFVAFPFVPPSKAIAISAGETPPKPRMPDESSIRIEEYPFTRRLYLYRNIQVPGESPHIQGFIDFAISEQGQRIVQRSGFVDQEIRLETPDPRSDAPEDFRSITAGAQRASLALRFESGKSILDNKAAKDLDRLKAFLENAHKVDEKILILGFADAKGKKEDNCKLSLERANAVRARPELSQFSKLSVFAFGQSLPLTKDTSEEGLAKSRRVEVWVTTHSVRYHGSLTCQPDKKHSE